MGQRGRKGFNRFTKIPGVSKKYPLLTQNRNEAIGYYYSPNKQLNVSIFDLDSHTLHLKSVHQRLERQACKVKIYSAPETRGFEKGPSHDLYHGYFPKYLFYVLNFNFQIFTFEKNKRLVNIAVIKQI